MLPLDLDLITRLVVFQAVLALLSIPVPILLPLAFTLLPVSVVMLPFVLAAYGRVLLGIASFSTRTMVDEQASCTLTLLRTTPLTLRSILFSKASASVWRQIEDISLILMAVTSLSMPVLALLYSDTWPMGDYVVLSRIALIAGLVVSIVRGLLEPFMIAALGIAIGAGVGARTPSLIALVGVGLFYFLLINLPRLLPLSLEMRLVVELILPVVLPLLIAWGAFRAAQYLVQRD